MARTHDKPEHGGLKPGDVEKPPPRIDPHLHDRGANVDDKERGGLAPGGIRPNQTAQEEWTSLCGQLDTLGQNAALAARRLSPEAVRDATQEIERIAHRLVELDRKIRSGEALAAETA